MYSKFELLQSEILKNGCLEHGCLHLLVCPKNKKHVMVAVRAFCPYCYAEKKHLERLFKCTQCDKIIQNMRNTLSKDVINDELSKLLCSHASRIPNKGFPFNSLGVHLCNMMKQGLLDLIPNKSVSDQLKIIRESIESDSFNPFLSINHFNSYLEMDLYTHAFEVAQYLDNNLDNCMESQFLEQEAEAFKEGTALYNLVNRNSMDECMVII